MDRPCATWPSLGFELPEELVWLEIAPALPPGTLFSEIEEVGTADGAKEASLAT